LYVSVLSAMPETKPVEPRYEAAQPYYLQGLRSDVNDVVRRAGAALEKVEDERAVPDLIKALITPHHYRVQIPDNTPTSARSPARPSATTSALGASGSPRRRTAPVESSVRAAGNFADASTARRVPARRVPGRRI
jgi:hypothetical protein